MEVNTRLMRIGPKRLISIDPLPFGLTMRRVMGGRQTVQELMGRQDIKMMLRYSHLSRGYLKGGGAKAEQRRPGP